MGTGLFYCGELIPFEPTLRRPPDVQTLSCGFLAAALLRVRAAVCADDLLEPSDLRGSVRVVNLFPLVNSQALVHRRKCLQRSNLFKGVHARGRWLIGNRHRREQCHGDQRKWQPHHRRFRLLVDFTDSHYHVTPNVDMRSTGYLRSKRTSAVEAHAIPRRGLVLSSMNRSTFSVLDVRVPGLWPSVTYSWSIHCPPIGAAARSSRTPCGSRLT